MKITPKTLDRAKACSDQQKIFTNLGEITVENVFVAASEGLDVIWCVQLLPEEGPGSQRAFALWCAEQVALLAPQAVHDRVLPVIRQRVIDPASVSDQQLAAARVTAGDAARSAARAAAWAAARSAAGAAARSAAGAAARVAAWDAARVAAGDATWAAAWAAAGAAAGDAAGDAARSAAWAAAWAAARGAARAAQITCLVQLLQEHLG